MNPKIKQNVWGITGGIASGKSTVAEILREEGHEVLDADEIAREVRRPGGPAHRKILSLFGTDDPTQIRRRIFESQELKSKLESILHPSIKELSDERLLKMIDDARKFPVFYEATLLVEAGRASEFSGVLLITSSTDHRVQRLIARDRMDREWAKKMIQDQTQDFARRDAATTVIENDGDLDELSKKVQLFLSRLH